LSRSGVTAFMGQYSCSSAEGRGFSNGSESKFSISCKHNNDEEKRERRGERVSVE
jgi:hypothetical protein